MSSFLGFGLEFRADGLAARVYRQTRDGLPFLRLKLGDLKPLEEPGGPKVGRRTHVTLALHDANVSGTESKAMTLFPVARPFL